MTVMDGEDPACPGTGDGEYIELWFDDHVKPRDYIRGHVDSAAAREAMKAHVEDYRDTDILMIEHKWARWEFPTEMERGVLGFERTFRPYERPGTGCFRVTAVTVMMDLRPPSAQAEKP